MTASGARIGYFGGSFDPPHIGHRAVALAAAQAFELDCVLLAPTGKQPLKPGAPRASFADRLAMTQRLCEDLDAGGRPLPRDAAASGADGETASAAQVSLDSPELPHPTRFQASILDAPHSDGSPNFTIDALRALQAANPQAQLFVIVGADAFAELDRWREPQALRDIADWIVVSRPDAERSHAADGSAGQRLSPAGSKTTQTERLHRLQDVAVPVSATSIRRSFFVGDDASALLTPSVLCYIQKHHLYR